MLGRAPCFCVHIISYLQVFQAFACEDFDEIGKSYLRADFRIECDTAKHKAYKIYAAVMICICEESNVVGYPLLACEIYAAIMVCVCEESNVVGYPY